jgi:hypothetical protein
VPVGATVTLQQGEQAYITQSFSGRLDAHWQPQQFPHCERGNRAGVMMA